MSRRVKLAIAVATLVIITSIFRAMVPRGTLAYDLALLLDIGTLALGMGVLIEWLVSLENRVKRAQQEVGEFALELAQLQAMAVADFAEVQVLREEMHRMNRGETGLLEVG